MIALDYKFTVITLCCTNASENKIWVGKAIDSGKLRRLGAVFLC